MKILDKDNSYTFDASFDEDKTMDVFRYIKDTIKTNSVLTSEEDRVDGSTSLSDGGIIHVKAHRGELTLTFDKKANGKEAYYRVKALGEGVRKICDVR